MASPNHQHSGFTFIEIVATVVILGLLATPLLIGQFQVISRLMPASSMLERLFFVENALVEQLGLLATKKDSKESKPVEKTLTQPDMKIKSEFVELKAKSIADKSTLKNFKNVQLVKAHATWTFAGVEQRETLVTFAYKVTPTGEGTP